MDFSNLSRQNENPTMIFTPKMTKNDEFLFLVVVVLIVVIGDFFLRHSFISSPSLVMLETLTTFTLN